jgi:hypothetical protein
VPHPFHATKTPPLLIGLAALLAPSASLLAASFVAGDLVVERIGDGTTALSGTATVVNVVEYAPAGGSPVQTIALPAAGTLPTANPFNLTDSGSATSNGYLNLSANGTALTIPGYNATAGTASVASSSATTNARTIGLITNSGVVDTSTAVTMLTSNNYRSVVSNSGGEFWASGAAGIAYVSAVGSTGSANVTSLFGGNGRILEIYGGQLYASSSSTSFNGTVTPGIFTLGNGLPTAVLGSPDVVQFINTGAGSSPYDFALSSDKLTAYIADDRTTTGGGIEKWTRPDTASAWTLAYTLGTGATNIGARGLTVNFASASGPTIYATTAEASANRLISVVDTGAASTPTTLATAGTNVIFRGVDFAPQSVPEPGTAASVAGGIALLLTLRRHRALR